MTDSAEKAVAIEVGGVVATSDTVPPTQTTGESVPSSNDTFNTSRCSASSTASVVPAPSYRNAFLLGGVALTIGVALWAFGIQAGATPLVTTIGLAGAIVVAGGTLHQALYGLSERRAEHDVASLLPLGGLLLISLSTICQFFVGDVPATAELSAAPVTLAGLYVVLRAFAARGWTLAGVQWSPLFPADKAQASSLVVGERVSLAQDSVAPVDIRITSGCVGVQERYLSPLTTFRVKDEGEIIFAGSTVVGGAAEGVALTSSDGSCLRRLESAIEPQFDAVQDVVLERDAHLARIYAYAMLFCATAAAISWNERVGLPSTVIASAGLVLYAGTLGIVVDLIYSSYVRMVRQWAGKGIVFLSPDSCRELARVKDVYFDPSTIAASSTCSVRELELLDDRVSKEALCGTVASLLGRAEDEAFAAFGDYCARLNKSITPERVVDLREYEGWGVSGSVKGIEFSIGAEGFLVERGIMIQPTDNLVAVAPNERVILVAIDSDVIARCVVAYGQQSIVQAESHDTVWQHAPDLTSHVASIEQRELPADALLVRGNESDAIARTHQLQMAWLGKDSLRPPQATALLLTRSLLELPEAISDCRENVKWTAWCRSLVLAVGAIMIGSVFLGFVTPLVPLVLLPIAALLVLF